MDRNIGENIRKYLSNKSSQKILDHGKQFAADILETTSKIAFKKQ